MSYIYIYRLAADLITRVTILHFGALLQTVNKTCEIYEIYALVIQECSDVMCVDALF